MRRPVIAVLAILVAAGVGAGWWLAGQREGTAPSMAIIPPPPPPPPVVPVLLGEGSGRLLTVADPDAGILSAEGQGALRRFADRTGTQALLIWHAGALQMEHYAPAVQPGDLLPADGLLPGLMALLTGIAVQDGSLPGIDDPLSRYFPEWKDDPRGRVTVRHLLEGTSGLSAPETPPGPDPQAWALAAPLTAEPGTRFQPNGFEAHMLGLVIARARQAPVGSYLADALWQPLGARPASIDTGSATGGFYLHCCLRATPRDWLRLGLLILEGGAVAPGASLVPTPWLDQMMRPQPASRNEGWRLRLAWPFDKHGPVRASHPFSEGDTVFLGAEGEGARLYVSRGRDLVILRIGPAGTDWDEAELPNLVAKSLTTEPAALRSDNGMKVMRARDLNGKVELPPINKPPPVPSVTVEPLDAPAPPDATETAPPPR